MMRWRQDYLDPSLPKAKSVKKVKRTQNTITDLKLKFKEIELDLNNKVQRDRT